jgi:hypothetical protein
LIHLLNIFKVLGLQKRKKILCMPCVARFDHYKMYDYRKIIHWSLWMCTAISQLKNKAKFYMLSHQMICHDLAEVIFITFVWCKIITLLRETYFSHWTLTGQMYFFSFIIVMGGGTLWHFYRFLKWFKDIIHEFNFSTISFILPPPTGFLE